MRVRRGFTIPLRALVLAAAILASGSEARGTGLYAVNASSMGDDYTTLAISHRDPSFVLVGTATGRIHYTRDGGATWQDVVVTPVRSVFYGRERQPDASWEYAPGLPGKSPYLQSWLRRSGLATSGINMAQLLSTKGEKSVTVNWIEVDWHDERRIWVGTSNGLYLSTDRARTFARIFQGRTGASERMITAVATDPFDARKILLGTASGLFTSTDRGRTFKKTMDYYLQDSYVREIWLDPGQKGLIHLALGGSAMASPDGGAHWITTHWTDWGPRADVQSLSLGPGNLRLIGTRDGIYASWQGGEMGTWKRRGIRFVGTTVTKVLASVDPTIWYALSDQALWGTMDSGLNWKKLYQLGGKDSPRWLAAFRSEHRHLWLLTNREIYRVGAPPKVARYNLAMRAAPRLLEVPPLPDLVRRVLKHNRLYFADNQRYRDRAPWAAFLPDVTAGFHYAPSRDFVTVSNYMYPSPYAYLNYSFDGAWPLSLDAPAFTWEVIAKWDLARLIFAKAALPHWGRIERNLNGVRQELTERVHRLYVEYRRNARILVFAPPADELTRQLHEIRVQEIAAYLDAVSGGYWGKATGNAETETRDQETGGES